MQAVSMAVMTLKVGDVVEVITPHRNKINLKVTTCRDDKVRLQSGLCFRITKALKTLPHGAYLITRKVKEA